MWSNTSGSTIVFQLTSVTCFGVCVCYHTFVYVYGLRLSMLHVLLAGGSHMDGMCTGE